MNRAYGTTAAGMSAPQSGDDAPRSDPTFLRALLLVSASHI